jgi:signal transduction histidine kinase
VGKGTGMGLSVSLGIAQSHRGFINAESTPGQGSIFSLILPVSASVSEESAVETVGSTKIN